MSLRISDNVVGMLIEKREYLNDASRCLDSFMNYCSELMFYRVEKALIDKGSGEPDEKQHKLDELDRKMKEYEDAAIASISELDRLCVEALGVHCCENKLPEEADRNEATEAIKDFRYIWGRRGLAMLRSDKDELYSGDSEN